MNQPSISSEFFYLGPYTTVSTNSNCISIVEGIKDTAFLTSDPFDPLKIKIEKLYNQFGDRELDMINIHEYAVLMQQSMRRCKESDGESKIVDFHKKEHGGTRTILGDRHLSLSSYIAVAYCDANTGQVVFGQKHGDINSPYYGGRPSAFVMNF